MAQSLVRVGTDVSGRPAELAPEAATWWRLFTILIKHVLGVDLEIIQARGTYAGSGGTHADGWCIDIRTWKFTTTQVLAIVALARLYGGSATWYRVNVGSGPHIHIAVDAGNLATASRYQTRAVRAGYDGLGYLGRSGKDTHPKPPTWRTATQGIAAMRTEIERTTQDMPLSSADVLLIRDEINRGLNNNPTVKILNERIAYAAADAKTAVANTAPISRGGKNRALRQEVADILTLVQAIAARLDNESNPT